MLKKVFYLYLIAIHLLLAVVLYKSNFVDLVKQKLGIWKVERTDHYYTIDAHACTHGCCSA